MRHRDDPRRHCDSPAASEDRAGEKRRNKARPTPRRKLSSKPFVAHIVLSTCRGLLWVDVRFSMRLASASRSSAVRSRAAHIAGSPARSAKARYQAANSRSLRTLVLGSSPKFVESMCRSFIAIASVDIYRDGPPL